MNYSFQDEDLEAFISDCKAAGNKYKKYARNKLFYTNLVKVFQIFYSVENTRELNKYSFLHYEKLKHTKEPISSVRVANNSVERILFKELNDGIEIIVLELDSTHYGNKK